MWNGGFAKENPREQQQVMQAFQREQKRAGGYTESEGGTNRTKSDYIRVRAVIERGMTGGVSEQNRRSSGWHEFPREPAEKGERSRNAVERCRGTRSDRAESLWLGETREIQSD